MNFRNLFSAKDMTQGAPWKRILEFSVPMLIGNIVQQLYNTADSIIVGLYVGDNALAAVGSAGPVMMILMAMFMGVATGAGIIISQTFGAKDREGLSKGIGNCLILAFFVSIIGMIVGPLITRPMLRLLSTPESIMDMCAEYLIIFFLGFGGFCFYNILSGVLRGLGDSVSALGFLALTAVMNIILNLWFVAGFDMGVPGVALATIISQFISAFFCFRKLMKMRDVFDLNRSTVKFDRAIAGRIIKIGIPAGVTQMIMSMANMLVQRLTNSMGEAVIAANVMLMRVDGFAMMPNFSFGQAMSVFAGQNVGARKYDRLGQGFKQGMIISVGTSIALTGILLMVNRFLFGCFTTTASLIELATGMMNIMAVGYACVAITQVCGGVMRGAGDTVTPMWISIATTIALRLPIAYIMAAMTKSEAWPNGHPYSLSASIVTAWVLGGVISVIAYRMGKWKKNLVPHE